MNLNTLDQIDDIKRELLSLSAITEHMGSSFRHNGVEVSHNEFALSFIASRLEECAKSLGDITSNQKS